MFLKNLLKKIGLAEVIFENLSVQDQFNSESSKPSLWILSLRELFASTPDMKILLKTGKPTGRKKSS